MLRIELVQAENDKLRRLLKQAYDMLDNVRPVNGLVSNTEIRECMLALKLQMDTSVPPETPKSQRIFGG